MIAIVFLGGERGGGVGLGVYQKPFLALCLASGLDPDLFLDFSHHLLASCSDVNALDPGSGLSALHEARLALTFC